MTEFTRMIREALVGEDRHEPEPSRAALDAALERLDRRDAVVRAMSWFTVVFFTAVAAVAAWRFFAADAADTRALVGWATLFVLAFAGIGLGKGYLFLMQAHLVVQRELKRVQIALHE